MPDYDFGVPLNITGASIHQIQLKTRMPFKYGIATMTEVPMVFVRLDTDVDGRLSRGVASDLLPPKWFTKVPDDPLDKEVADMLRVIRRALSHSIGVEAPTAFVAWQGIYERQAAWAKSENIAPLLAHFGTSLAERALIESVCRATSKTLGQALRDGTLGFQPGAIHPALAKRSALELLPQSPLASVLPRHTVGLGDPLSADTIPDDEKLDDSLPQSLDQCIHAYGLRHFKIKITGDIDADLERLRTVASAIDQHAPRNHAFSLDGNEQFNSVDDFRKHWIRLADDSTLTPFFRHLLFVEQPLHRDIALEDSVKEGFDNWPGRPPIIIDESDATIKSLPTALALGYAGTSHKNCKGIFKGVANACLLNARRETGQTSVMSGEDLCNVGPVAVIQDLAVMAALGIESVERNGHHYMAGLSQFPEATQRQVLDAHTGLYRTSERGWPTLDIRDGRIDLASVNSQPFGTGFELDLSPFGEISLIEG
ncbi:MAG: hypothetical protein VX598_09260 [Verrucomicrobiota bacterium]|nr:hypothetical protein [Verrucomicrobiota bacterium]